MYSRFIDRLDRATQWPRQRYAENVFFTGRGRFDDRLLSRLYFELSASRWAQRAYQQADHLAPFNEVLARCPAPARALDLGTGAGATAALLAERFPDAEVIGLDGSRAMLRVAAASARAPNLRFMRADLRRLPFPNAHFDLVTMHNAMPEPRELGRVCRQGGLVAIANSYWPEWDLTRRCRLESFGLRTVASGQIGDGGWLLLERAVR